MAKFGSKKGDSKLILALASGHGTREAAQQAGVSIRTAYRRIDDPLFRQKVTAARDEMFRVAVGSLASAAVEAVDTLRDLLTSQSPTAQLGAARAILDLGQRLREATEIDARLRVLEEGNNAISAAT